jgi:glycosyltransferase involved in cell wall biosynthesis
VEFFAAVIICTYDRAARLRQALQSLAEMRVLAKLAWEVIVVDNNSNDNTREVVEEFARKSRLCVRYVFEPKQGLSHARNAGVAHAKSEIIAFTDDDVLVSPEWLSEIVRTFEECDCIAVAGKIIPAWGDSAKPNWLLITGPYRLGAGLILGFDLGNERQSISYLLGANMAFRKSAFERFGIFRTDLGMCGSALILGEDSEFGNRLTRAGETIAYSPTACVFHPVKRERLTKPFILSWYYQAGRSSALVDGISNECTCYLGVPRHLLRRLFITVLKWCLSLHTGRRFYYKAGVYQECGRILELHRRSRSTKTQLQCVGR